MKTKTEAGREVILPDSDSWDTALDLFSKVLSFTYQQNCATEAANLGTPISRETRFKRIEQLLVPLKQQSFDSPQPNPKAVKIMGEIAAVLIAYMAAEIDTATPGEPTPTNIPGINLPPASA